MAIYDLKLSADEFYSITPRQLDALIKRRRIEIESHELLFGQLTSWIANTGFRTAEKQTTAIDFMPSMWAKKAKATKAQPATRTRMTKKKRMAIWQALRANLAPIARKG